MKKIIIFTLLISFSILGLTKEMSCFTKAEVGEDTNGQNLFERTDTFQIEKMSKMDFDKKVIINADTGTKTQMQKVEENMYLVQGGKYSWYYITNDLRTIVTETSINETTVYSKILFCK